MTEPSEADKALRASQILKQNAMREPSKADRQAMVLAAKNAAAVVNNAIYESKTIETLFSTSQLKRLNQWCKKHDIDRRVAISEIIEAGMKAKGIVS